MEQKPLIIILADISGYTRFMVESRLAAVHGQVFISGLIEGLLRHVAVPSSASEDCTSSCEQDHVRESFVRLGNPGGQVMFVLLTSSALSP